MKNCLVIGGSGALGIEYNYIIKREKYSEYI